MNEVIALGCALPLVILSGGCALLPGMGRIEMFAVASEWLRGAAEWVSPLLCEVSEDYSEVKGRA